MNFSTDDTDHIKNGKIDINYIKYKLKNTNCYNLALESTKCDLPKCLEKMDLYNKILVDYNKIKDEVRVANIIAGDCNLKVDYQIHLTNNKTIIEDYKPQWTPDKKIIFNLSTIHKKWITANRYNNDVYDISSIDCSQTYLILKQLEKDFSDCYLIEVEKN